MLWLWLLLILNDKYIGPGCAFCTVMKRGTERKASESVQLQGSRGHLKSFPACQTHVTKDHGQCSIFLALHQVRLIMPTKKKCNERLQSTLLHEQLGNSTNYSQITHLVAKHLDRAILMVSIID